MPCVLSLNLPHSTPRCSQLVTLPPDFTESPGAISHCQGDTALFTAPPSLPPSKGQASPWAQAPTHSPFPRTLFSSCLLSTTISLSPLQNNSGRDRNHPPGLTPPFIYCPIFLFLFTNQLLGKYLHQLSLLPYLSFAPQAIPTWLPFPQLN